MKKISVILVFMVLFTSCGETLPVQTSSHEAEGLIAVTFNDTTTLHFRITTDGEAQLTWDATDGKNYNTPTRYRHKGKLVLPAEITHAGKNYKVTSIDNNALFQQRSLESIYIPDGIRHIGVKALSGCDKLKSLRLPATLETLGEEAISRCKQLKSLTIPESIREIGKYALHDCKMLRKATIPLSITELPEGLFEGCYSLNDIELHGKTSFLE